MQRRFLVKINKAREIFKRLLSQGWREINQFGHKKIIDRNFAKHLKAEFKDAIL